MGVNEPPEWYLYERYYRHYPFHRQMARSLRVSVLALVSVIVLSVFVAVSYLYYPEHFLIVFIFSSLTALLVLLVYYSFTGTTHQLDSLTYSLRSAARATWERERFGAHRLSDSERLSYESRIAKRNELTKTPRIFYYLDKSVIESLHNQIASSIRTKEITTESGKTTAKGIELKLPVHPSYQSEQLRTERRRAEVVESIERQFEDVLNHLLDHELVEIGIEEFNYDKTTENDFLATCSEIKEKFDFELPKNVQDQFVKINIQKYVDAKLQEIEALSGYVLISGDFGINSKGDDWIVVYDHPVNEAVDWETGERLTFKSSCSKTEMTNIGNGTFNKTNRAKFVLLGNIVKFDKGKRELVMRPIAMCS